MTHLLGIDYGTSQFKIHLYDLNGQPISMGGGAIPVQQPQPGWVEQDSVFGWQEVARIIRQVTHQAGVDPQSILAIGTTGTTNINLLDRAGHPLRPAILYGDQRLPPSDDLRRIKTEAGSKRIGEAFGFETLDDSAWALLLRLMMGSKLLWLHENEPDVFREARACVASSWDYVNLRLTGAVAHWAGALDTDRWLLASLDLPEDFFGRALAAGEIVGRVTEHAASACGLAEGTPVIMGATDSLCSFLGAGIASAGLALNNAGTTDVVAVCVSNRPESDVGYPVRHLLDGLWMCSLSPVRGPTLQWFLETLLPSGSTFSDFDSLAAQAPLGAEGLMCLPTFSGEKGLVHDPHARGALVGFDLHHGRPHMARAALEGIAFSLYEILNAYRDEGHDWQEIRLCGGGARSDLWNQIKADVIGMEVSVLRVLETGCLGAAILASVAAGVDHELSQASRRLAVIDHVIEPNPAHHERYHSMYHAFQKLYPAIQPSLQFLEPGLI